MIDPSLNSRSRGAELFFARWRSVLANKKRNKGLSHDCKAEVSSQSQITLQLLSPVQHALLTALPNVSALALQIGVGNMLRIDNYE